MSPGDEISLNNTAAVPEANVDTDAGVVEKIRMQALAEQTTARVQLTKADEASSKAGGNDGFSVIASAAIDAVAPGAKAIITGGEFVNARVEDKHALQTPAVGAAPARHIETGIVESTTRAPGLYTNNVSTSTYGGDPKTATDLGANIATRARIAETSLRQPKDSMGLVQTDKTANLSGVKCETDNKTLQTAQLAKSLVFGNQIASQKALDSTIVWEKAHSAARGAAMGMGGPAANLRLAPRDLNSLVSDGDTQRA